MNEFQPAYLEILRTGELRSQVEQAYTHLQKCDLCPWKCGVDRQAGKLGVCKTGEKARVSSYGAHMGEENPLRGWRGSGTIFFSRCNLRCQFCQNADISQVDRGDDVTSEDLAAIMLELQAAGCHNINLVSPSHVVPQIIAAVWIAAQAGLQLPLVYNTGGYDSLTALKLLNRVIDIYMPDMKYSNPQVGLKYSKVRNYPAHNQAAVLEMHRQVGDLQIDGHGLACRGLLVRHLVLPFGLAGSDIVFRFLAEKVSTHTYLNLMDQYRPAYNAKLFPNLNRQITLDEYQTAVQLAYQAGLQRLDQ